MAGADPILVLVKQLSRLPGIGERTAQRLAHYLLNENRALMRSLADALTHTAAKVQECPRCCNLTARESFCLLCENPRRNQELLCVIAKPEDLIAIEKSNEFSGLYHVLHGTLAPLSGVGPEQLRIKELLSRLMDGDARVSEVILATPPTVDGEATALFLTRNLAQAGVKISRIASGIPVGGQLQYADKVTLARAISERREIGTFKPV
jgi:recombination protein RecR